MTGSPNGLSNAVELQIVLGVNSSASKVALNKQIKDIEKQLSEVKLDIKIDPKAIAALDKLSKMDFSKLADSLSDVKKKTEKLGSATASEVEEAMKKATEAIGINFKKVIKGSITDLDALKKELAGTNANIKVKFDVKNGREELNTLKASIEREGITQTVTFEKVSRQIDDKRSDIVWMPKAIEETDKQLSNAAKSTNELIAKMNKLQTEGKITNQQFEALTSSIGQISKNSDLARVNQMMDEMVVSTKKQNQTLVDHQQEQQRLIKNERARKSAILDVEKAMKTQSKTLNMDDANSLIGNLKGMDVASKNFNNSLKDNQLEFKRMKTVAAEASREQLGMVGMFKQAMEKFPIKYSGGSKTL